MTKRESIIYGLFDPRDGELRYVGKTPWTEARWTALRRQQSLNEPRSNNVG